jgi:hypothetical protein
VKVLDSSHVEVTEQFFACGVSMADSNEGDIAAETAPTATIAKLPDLVWDEEAPGLCIRVHGNGTKSFLFVYRISDRQRLLKIGETPKWWLAAARTRAKELRAIVDEGNDPESYNRVENVIRDIAEQLGRKSE